MEVCYWNSNWQYVSIGSGNVSVPNGRQAITWTNDDPVHLRIYAALGGDELSECMGVPHIVWLACWFREVWCPATHASAMIAINR